MNDNEKSIQQKYLDARSIHVFAYPFILENEESEKEIKEILKGKGWSKRSFNYQEYKANPDAMREIYMYEKYLSSEAQDIWNIGTKTTTNAECVVYEKLTVKEQDFSYIIRTKDKEYKLLIDAFELHIYGGNIGILFIKALNMDKQSTIDDIKCINNQGRCIALPFLPANFDGDIECPEQLGISFIDENGEKIERVKNYREKVKSILISKEEDDTSVNFLSQIINWDFRVLDKTKETPEIEYQIVNDHRMFVMGLIVDDTLSNEIKDLQLENEAIEDKWYSILHIDNGDATCRHTKMRRELLQTRTYERWNGYGTVYGATQYSFMAITGDNSDSRNIVVKPFYKEYIYMMSLVLAQKIEIMEFSKKAEKLADDMKKKKKDKKLIEKRLCQKLVDLQEKYIVWKNKMLIPEFSNQEQGVELYQLMQEQFLVHKKKEMLDEQLRGMYDVVTVSNSSRDSKDSLIVALGAFIISVIALFLQ